MEERVGFDKARIGDVARVEDGTSGTVIIILVIDRARVVNSASAVDNAMVVDDAFAVCDVTQVGDGAKGCGKTISITIAGDPPFVEDGTRVINCNTIWN